MTQKLTRKEQTMTHAIRTRLMATTATAAAMLGGAATGAAATGGYQPFVTDFPRETVSTAFTPFVTDFGLASRPPGSTVAIRTTKADERRSGGRPRLG
jgi:hypothetical protein